MTSPFSTLDAPLLEAGGRRFMASALVHRARAEAAAQQKDETTRAAEEKHAHDLEIQAEGLFATARVILGEMAPPSAWIRQPLPQEATLAAA